MKWLKGKEYGTERVRSPHPQTIKKNETNERLQICWGTKRRFFFFAVVD